MIKIKAIKDKKRKKKKKGRRSGEKKANRQLVQPEKNNKVNNGEKEND